MGHSLLEEQGRHRDSVSFGKLNQKFTFPIFLSLSYFISKYNRNKNKKSQKKYIAAMLDSLKEYFLHTEIVINSLDGQTQGAEIVDCSPALQLHRQSLILLLKTQKSYSKEPPVNKMGK